MNIQRGNWNSFRKSRVNFNLAEIFLVDVVDYDTAFIFGISLVFQKYYNNIIRHRISGCVVADDIACHRGVY